jgi:hypothetical protein
MRRRVEKHWDAVFGLRRGLQRDAGGACRAYLAAVRERARGANAVRARLGLNRKALEDRAKGHVERAGWMRHYFTKATALHVADEVWQSADRFLFTDARGQRHGMPRVGSWWDFTRIPGRARSHTKRNRTVVHADPVDPRTATIDHTLRNRLHATVLANRTHDLPLTRETAQQEGPVRSTIHHNPTTPSSGTGEDGSQSDLAPAGQGERPALPRNRPHGYTWGRRQHRRTSKPPNDSTARVL